MKFFVIIFLISFFLPSCKRKEIVSYDVVCRERDSLEYLLHLTRSFNTSKDTILNEKKYYIVGKDHDLEKKGIIRRVSGISREFKLCNDFPKHHFICAVEQSIDSVVVYGKYVRLIGRFDPEYYSITGGDKDEYHVVRIKDKNRFWQENLYLVITHQ